MKNTFEISKKKLDQIWDNGCSETKSKIQVAFPDYSRSGFERPYVGALVVWHGFDHEHSKLVQADNNKWQWINENNRWCEPMEFEDAIKYNPKLKDMDWGNIVQYKTMDQFYAELVKRYHEKL